MAFQPVVRTAEAVVRFTANSVGCTMTFYGFFEAGNYNQGNLEDLASLMDAWADTNLVPRLSDEATYDGVNVRGLQNENDWEVFNNDNAAAGAVAFPAMPNSVCLAVKRSSAFTGRSARGRVYFPLHSGMIDAANENLVDVTPVGNIVTALDAVRAGMDFYGWSESIVSRYANGVKRAAGVGFYVTGYSVVDRRVDTQRRRLG